MKQFLFALTCLCALTSVTCFAQKDVLERANQLELSGRFKEAAATLTQALENKALSAADRQQLEFDLDRLARIKQDFPFTKESLFTALTKSVQDLTAEEYEAWVSEGRFDSREIDGVRCFMVSSPRNLFFRYPELGPRRTPPKDTTALQKARVESVTAIKTAAVAEKRPYVLPRRFHVTMTVTAHANAAPAGETVRAWIPIPREYPFQRGIQVRATTPPARNIDGLFSPIRSAYFEQPALQDKPTRFQVEYDYTAYGVWFDVNPSNVRPCNTDISPLKPYTCEAPHVVFTPEIRALSSQIVGDETNPYFKAKKCYDWIAENIKYSYALEYSTIRNISEYCRSKGYGDCGQEALLFITLCRLNGIPARWQSGWNLFTADKTNHDWAEIYLAPYGWMPVDPYMGIFAMRYCPSLKPEERRSIRDFYFGGLDQYRMAANSDHSQALNPPKRSIRSDDVDFQRGELEYGDKNIYFGKFSYTFDVTELSK